MHNIRFNIGIHALEDWLFWVDIARYNAKFSEIEDKLVLYRVHTNSTTHNKLYMQQNYLKSYFRMYEILSQQERKEFLQCGIDNLVNYFAQSNYNKEAEKRANSIDYKIGALLLFPLHKVSSLFKKLIRKLKS